MPAGRGKKTGKAAAVPLAPAEEALCPELEEQEERASGPEDSPGTPLTARLMMYYCSLLLVLASSPVSEVHIAGRKRPREQGAGLG